MPSALWLVFPPAQVIAGLSSYMHGAGVGHGTATSLLAKLAAAQSDLDVGNSASAVQDLTDRVNEANAQSGKHVSSAQAHAIVDEARTRLDAIGILQG